jgi:hypothetical protein
MTYKKNEKLNILKYPLLKRRTTYDLQSPMASPPKKRHCLPMLDWTTEPKIHPDNHWFDPNGIYFILYRELNRFVIELHKFFDKCAVVIPSCDNPFSWQIISCEKGCWNRCEKGDCGDRCEKGCWNRCEKGCYEANVTVFRSPVPQYRKDQEILVVEINCISQDHFPFYEMKEQLLAKLQGRKYVPMFCPDYDAAKDLSEEPDC